MTPRRVGILGGTFDPIHCGHLDAARAADAALRFDRLLIVPSNVPPHRPQPAASPFHRFAMVALAVAGTSGWEASDLELSDPARSYTWTTLERLHKEYEPRELFFIIGADAFSDIESWKRYPEILDAAHFAVVSRPGWPAATLRAKVPALAHRMVPAGDARALSQEGTWQFLIDARTADVAATAIRKRLASGDSVAGLVPPAVAAHIQQHRLYREG